MKRLGLVISIILSFVRPVHADTLRPLEEVFAQEQSPSMLIYVMKRCSGLYTAVSIRIEHSGRPNVADLVESNKNLAFKFASVAQSIAEKRNLNQPFSKIVEDAMKLTSIYDEMMDEHYLRTGNAFSGLVTDDLFLCKAIIEAIK